MTQVSFVIPFHNEEKNVSPMVKRVLDFARSQKWQFEIIPVDDRSSDNTKNELQTLASKHKQVRPIYRKNDDSEKGNTMGKALLAGTKKAQFPIIIWTMGDLADDTNTYKDIVKKIENGYDMIFGSRYMPGGSRGNLDPLKAFLSSWGTYLAQALFGVKVHDITNAFRGFKRSMIAHIQLNSPGFSISPELAIKAHLAGFTLGEVPTLYTNRIEGISSFKLYKMMKSYLQLYVQLFYQYRLLHKPYNFVINK